MYSNGLGGTAATPLTETTSALLDIGPVYYHAHKMNLAGPVGAHTTPRQSFAEVTPTVLLQEARRSQ
jgi:hypothetical protein